MFPQQAPVTTVNGPGQGTTCVSLQIVFLVSVYVLVTYSGLMLAFAEGAVHPQGWTLPLAVLAFIFNERLGKLTVSNLWANVLGLAGFLVAGAEFFSPNIEGRLLSGAHLLVYLTWIVLFQRKSAKQYWWMCALSVLQVAVGSVLTQAGAYGAMLVLYLFLAVWTLSVFSLSQAQVRFAGTETRAVLYPVPAVAAGAVAGVVTPPHFVLHPTAPVPRSQARWAIQLDPRERWIGWRFVTGTAASVCVALVISWVFFLLIPRVWIGRGLPSADLPAEPGRTLTGFTDEVQLGDIGEILESNDPVLEVQLFDHDSGEPLSMDEYLSRAGFDEPLFRGTVLGQYRNGRWSPGDLRGGRPSISRLPPRPGMLRQEIRLHPIGTATLFALHPVEVCWLKELPGEVGKQPVTSVLSCEEAKTASRLIVYEAFTPKDATADAGLPMPMPRQIQAHLLQVYLELPAGLERLQQLARGLGGDAQSQATARYVQAARDFTEALAALEDLERFSPRRRLGEQREALLEARQAFQAAVVRLQEASAEKVARDEEAARALVAYLRDSGRFGYSLNLSVVDARIDPVEDFLFNRKEGHCEYYASALALMLRAVQIPSRLVSGFKGGVTNRFSNSFEVEQRHAHAWVEAFIGGRWIVLDATPAVARAAVVEQAGYAFPSLHDFRTLIGNVWTSQVLNMSFAHQQDRYYGPLWNIVGGVWEGITQGDPARLSEAFFPLRRLLRHPQLWFSWQGGVATFLLLLLLAALVWGGRRLDRALGRLWREWQVRRRQQQRLVEFYERFQRICAAQGLFRPPAQTQREFAESVRQALSERLRGAGLWELPGQLIEAFYGVRFGRRPLEERRLAELDRQLRLLEECLKTA